MPMDESQKAIALARALPVYEELGERCQVALLLENVPSFFRMFVSSLVSGDDFRFGGVAQ